MTFELTLRRTIGAHIAPLLVFCIFALAAPARAEAADVALWKLSDEDSEIWLFGTVHIMNPAIEWRSDKVSKALDTADTLVTEAPAVDIAPATQMKLVQTYGINLSGPSFIEKLSPEAFENFETVLTGLGMPASAVNNFAPYRPWMAGISLQALTIQARGGTPDAGVDSILWREAKAKGKSLAYLETLDEQMQVFGNLSFKDELFFFEESVRQIVEDPDMLDEIVTLWLEGDMENLGDKMQAAMVGQETLADALLLNRNANWADQIKTMMDGEGKIFIAVGAAHLAGQDSVQELLAEKYGLTAVRQ
ncbi:TraB/GumN family protein [Kordiimonas lipolytica]|uniref:TraB/GumN family protein n=1 Tax=Kordiimonas lipolytica TaxID=1662421 RepID=A0ABV8UB76_9PROT|nr:TraB/GumN family protein [Kordiimonas lipolytica]